MTEHQSLNVGALLSAILFLGLSAAGCHTAATPTPPAIRGTVTSVLALRGDDRVAVIVIEENPNEKSGSGKDAVTIDQQTEVFKATATRLVVTDWSEITNGTRLEAWYRGAVAESYPRQATAQRLVILEQQTDGAP